MPRALSPDLRERVIDAVMRAGMTCRAAARRFGVGESTAIRWVAQYRETGRRSPVGTGGHRPSVLKPHRDFLAAALAEQPDITLAALSRRLAAARSVRADTSMLSRFFRRERITFKKRRWSRASATARTSAAAARSGASIRAGSPRAAWSSSMRPGRGPT